MEKIGRIKNIIRKGRIERIDLDTIVFKGGDKMATDSATLHVDCSAAGTLFPPVNKIFDSPNNKINLQMVQLPQPCTSGAIIAAMELR